MAVFCVNQPFSGSETFPTRFLAPKNPWAEHTFMTAMAMVWKPLTKTKFKVSKKKTETLNRFSNVYYSMINGPRSLNLGLKFAGTCPFFNYNKVKWMGKLQIGNIALFHYEPNWHRFFKFNGETCGLEAL
jgi:hypothetical protein